MKITFLVLSSIFILCSPAHAMGLSIPQTPKEETVAPSEDSDDGTKSSKYAQ